MGNNGDMDRHSVLFFSAVDDHMFKLNWLQKCCKTFKNYTFIAYVHRPNDIDICILHILLG